VPRLILILIVHYCFSFVMKVARFRGCIYFKHLSTYDYCSTVISSCLFIRAGIMNFTKYHNTAGFEYTYWRSLLSYIYMRQSKNKSEFINYFVYNSLWQMQSLALLEIITPFFQHILCSCSQAFWSCLRRQILIVIEATNASRSNVMIAGKSSSAQWFLVVDQTYDNPIELGTDCIGGVGEVQISAACALQR
jgi:hypothetical protein